MFGVGAVAATAQTLDNSAESSSTNSIIPITDFKQPVYLLAKVIEVADDSRKNLGDNIILNQTLKVQFLSGEEKGAVKSIVWSTVLRIPNRDIFKVSDRVIVLKNQIGNDVQYNIDSRYRLPSLFWIFIIFLALAIYLGRSRGFFSIIGLSVSIAILIGFVMPHIINGGNPLFYGITGVFAIAVLSIYIAHGFNKRTSIAVLSTCITLVFAFLISLAFVNVTNLFGAGSEEANNLYLNPSFDALNLKGLLLTGIIIGVLGILNDVTTAQAATIDELKKANPALTLHQLYSHGMSVGKEHIASLINTLVLAYAGVSLPLFLIFLSDTSPPFWVILNSEFLAEEVVRTLIGSIALILAVPISTFLAAYFLSRQKVDIEYRA